MLLHEKNSLNTYFEIIPPRNLNLKLESFTNRFLDCLHKKDIPADQAWVVFDLKGKILASGATPALTEMSDSLF
jgi:hypothetical protein